MNICLIRCSSPFLIDDKVFPPLGLMAVGTVINNCGHEVHIHDGPVSSIPMDYNVYGLGPTTPEYPEALNILRHIKQDNTKAKVVLGGPHANDNCRNDGFDNVITGNIGDENLIIDRSLLDIKGYKYFINDRLTTTLVTTVGCPYKCAFCSKNYSKVKFKSAEKVIEEIEMLHFQFDYNALMFFDDTFILNRKRVEKICKRLKELGIIWRCFVRADLVIKHGNELLDIMADSGCVEIGMGIESGSDIILRNINKGETVQDIKLAIKMIREKGIRVKGFIIVGLPGESEQTLGETRTFLDAIQLDDVDFTVFRPYPGSHIYSNKERYDIQWSDIDDSKMFYKGKAGEYHSIVSTSGLSSDAIVMARESMEGDYGLVSNNSGA